jgi:hypothetical protein
MVNEPVLSVIAFRDQFSFLESIRKLAQSPRPRGPTVVVGHARAGDQWRPRPRGRGW